MKLDWKSGLGIAGLVVLAAITVLLVVGHAHASNNVVTVKAAGQATRSVTQGGYIEFSPNATLESIEIKAGWSARLCADPDDSTHQYVVLQGPVLDRTAYNVGTIIVLQGDGAFKN